jgi:hypothetical protein
MKSKTLSRVVIAALTIIAATPASAASFIGDAVTIKRVQGGTDVFKSVSTNVGAGAEYTDNFFNIDVTANQVIFASAGGTFSLGDIVYEITGLDFDDTPSTPNLIQDFSATQIFKAPNVLITSDRASITPAGAFRMSFNQTTGSGSGLATITFGAPIESAVPETTTWAMMLIGFGAVGYSMRSRKASKKAIQLV